MQLNFLDYLEDITSILKYNGIDILDLWKEFIIDCISKIFNNIYDKTDYIFNTPNNNDIIELIEIISWGFNDDFARSRRQTRGLSRLGLPHYPHLVFAHHGCCGHVFRSRQTHRKSIRTVYRRRGLRILFAEQTEIKLETGLPLLFG